MRCPVVFSNPRKSKPPTYGWIMNILCVCHTSDVLHISFLTVVFLFLNHMYFEISPFSSNMSLVVEAMGE